MRILKYIFLFLVTAGIIAAVIFVLPSFKNSETTLLPTSTSFPTPQVTSTFSLLNAPSQSLRGEITKMSGEISWQDRVATEAGKLTEPVTIQQGEKLVTGGNSRLNLVFPDAASIDYSENTSIDIIQTLPANLVFSQNSGTAVYSKIGNLPITARTKSLLTNIEGKVEVSYDIKKPLVTLNVISGTILLAFNDIRYISHEVSVADGHTYTFNYDTRKGVLK